MTPRPRYLLQWRQRSRAHAEADWTGWDWLCECFDTQRQAADYVRQLAGTEGWSMACGRARIEHRDFLCTDLRAGQVVPGVVGDYGRKVAHAWRRAGAEERRRKERAEARQLEEQERLHAELSRALGWRG